jgi:sugar lactone lactonase YvrE
MKLKFVGLLLMVVFGVLASQSADLADFDLPPGYMAEKVFTPPLQAPNHIAISPSDIIVVTDWGLSDRVIQVHEDGTLSTYAAPSSGGHFGIVFDSAGNLYVAGDGGVLWKVTPGGVATEFASGVPGFQLDIAPSGDIFSVGGDGTDVQRITSDGQVSVYATGLTRVCDLAVSPVTGDVYVYDMNASAIYRANPDGTVTLLTSGLMYDWTYLTFSPDGELYDTELSIISTVDGTRTELTWAKDSWANLHPSDIAFDSQGRLVAVDVTYNHVVRFDLDAETIEVIWLGMGNSRGLAVAPGGGGVYLGINHPCADGQGRVVRIEEDGSTTLFVDDLLPEVEGLVFDADGVGYIIATGLVGGRWRSRVYSITLSGVTSTLATLPYPGCSLAVDPITGYLWGLSYGELWYLDDTGAHHTISTASVGELVESITFTPDGTLYVMINTADFQTTSVERGVYRVDPTGPTFTLIADLSTINTCCPMGRIGAGKDGNIYWVGFGDRHTPNNDSDMHMLRITPAGEVTLFGRYLPMDPAAVTGDPDSTDLYFCGGNGVYRVFKIEE